MRLTTAAMLTAILTGCANIQVSTPNSTQVERSRTFDVPFEPAWSGAVDWFADNNISIEKIEKSSGLLTAKYALEVNQNILDCGKIEHSGLLRAPAIIRAGTLNVTVREVEANKTRVNINFFGTYLIQGNDAWDASLVSSSGKCVSTGLLEKSILNSISKKK
jgi:hypothetical protein